MLLDVQSLSKTYTRNGRQFIALKEARLRVDAGELACIRGRSGSGKTTLLTILAGLQTSTGGTVALDGIDLNATDDTAAARIRNDTIAYIPQGQNVLPTLTVIENVVLPFYLQKRTGTPYPRAKELLEQCGIAHLAQAYPASLSRGELHRVQTARAFINSPRLILADEPTANLDDKTSATIIRLFRQAADTGMAVLMASHEQQEHLPGDSFYVMEDGTLRREQ